MGLSLVREEESRLILTDDKRIYLLPIAYAYVRMSNIKQYRLDIRFNEEAVYWWIDIGDNKSVCIDIEEGIVYRDSYFYDVAEWYDIEACDRIVCKLANKMKQHLGEQNER